MNEHSYRDYRSVFGKLAFAAIASDASGAIRDLLGKAEVDREPIQKLATELPYLFGVPSLTELKNPAHVDTESMIICIDAMKTGLGIESAPSVPGVIADLEMVRARIDELGSGTTIPVEQLKELRRFCIALAKELLDHVPPPDPPAGSIR